MKVLIVEDEILAQEELVRIMNKNFPQMQIAGILSSVEESVRWLNENEADLILMDVHLSDGICFEIFEQAEVHTPVIFTTAYEQYAIDAFKVNGIGYILKPVLEEELTEAVRKLEYSPLNLKRLMDHMKPAKGYKTRIMVKSGDIYGHLSMSDISYFFSEDRLTFAMSSQGRRHMVDYTIESLEPQLDPKHFFKITRGCIASINSIERISRYFNSRLKVTLKPQYDGELLISRARVPEFLRWLDGE